MSTEPVTTARFKIRNVTTSSAWSDFEDAGFDFSPGDVLAFKLSEAPALDITETLFRNDDPAGRISGGTALSFPSGGVATTPTSEVQVTTSGEVGTWAVECLVNGGTEAHQRRTRYIAARTANLDLRFMLQGERNEYNPIGGYVVSLQELIVAVDSVAGGVPTTRVITTTSPIRIAGGGSADLSADRTLSFLVAADVAWNAHKITGLANGAASDDAAAFGQIASALASYVPTSRTLTGTSPITIAGDNSAHDLSANRTVAFTVAADIPWAGFGITGLASIDNAAGTMTIGGAVGSLLFAPAGTSQISTFRSPIEVQYPGAANTLPAVGLLLNNSTNASGGTTVQRSPPLKKRGTAFISAAVVPMYTAWQMIPSTSTTIAEVLFYNHGSDSEAMRWDELDSSLFDGRVRASNGFVAAQGSGGYAFTDGSGMYRGGSSELQLSSLANSTAGLLKSAKSTGATSAAWRVWANAGTHTAGYWIEWGGGSSFAQGGGIAAADNVLETPTKRLSGLKTANYTASFYEFVETSPPMAGLTIKLPDPTNADKGKTIWVCIEGTTAFTTTITTVSGTATIDDATTKTITGTWPIVELTCLGTNGYKCSPHI